MPEKTNTAMTKVRIYDIAQELHLSPREVLDMLNKIGVPSKAASSSFDEKHVETLRKMAPEPKAVAPIHKPSSQPTLSAEQLELAKAKERIGKLEAQVAAMREENDGVQRFRKDMSREKQLLHKENEQLTLEVEKLQKQLSKAATVAPVVIASATAHQGVAYWNTPFEFARDVEARHAPLASEAFQCLNAAATSLEKGGSNDLRSCLLDCTCALEKATEALLRTHSLPRKPKLASNLESLVQHNVLSEPLSEVIYEHIVRFRNKASHGISFESDEKAAKMIFFSTCLALDALIENL